MIVQLTTSVPSAVAAKEDTASPFQDAAVLPENLSLAERETYNLALDAQNGDNVLDKVILNVVQPPALVLFALLDAGRVFPDVPLPQAQDAYDRMADTTEIEVPDVGDSSKNQPEAKPAEPDSGLAASGSNAISLPIAAGKSPASSTISTLAPSITA